jgi:anti-anti-sigma factor
MEVGVFHIRVDRTAPDRYVVSVSGELDLTVAGQLCQVVPGPAATAWIVVDLAGTTMIDSSAVKELVDAHRLAARRGHILIARNAHGIVGEVLRITGVAGVLGLATRGGAGTVYGGAGTPGGPAGGVGTSGGGPVGGVARGPAGAGAVAADEHGRPGG